MDIGAFTIESSKPAIMGIVNVTPDSFSDGGHFFETSSAIAQAFKLIEDGADILDVGGESSRPGAELVSVEEELRRTIPVIEGIRKKTPIPISIDTTKSVVAVRAIDAGANMINDISSGKFDPEIFTVAASNKVPICLMHMQGTPRTMQVAPHYDDLIGEIISFLSDAACSAEDKGVERSKIIIDPGIGFGKSAKDNVKILVRLKEFQTLKLPVLIGTSRKSFIGKMLGLDVDSRLEASLATLAVAVDGGVSILRVHDVGPTKRFLDMYSLLKEKSSDGAKLG